MLSFQSCTGWGLQNGQVAMPLVSSYLAFPSLPENGRYISVALSLKSPSPGVTRHPALRCSDFPHLKMSRDRLSYSPSKVIHCLRKAVCRNSHTPGSYPLRQAYGWQGSAETYCIRCIFLPVPQRQDCCYADVRVCNGSSK